MEEALPNFSHAELSEYNESDLLGILADPDYGESDRNLAWGTLYQRHHKFIEKQFEKKVSYYRWRASAAYDLTVELFQKIYETNVAVKFKSEGKVGIALEKRFLNWILTIGERMLLDKIRSFSREPRIDIVDNYSEKLYSLFEEDNEAFPSEKAQLVENWFNGLKPKDQEILLTYLPYKYAGEDIPTHELDRLIAFLGCARSTPSVTWVRLSAKLKDYLASNLKVV